MPPAAIEHQYNDKTERLDIKKISGGATVPGPFNWAGVVDQYFAAVFLPEDIQNAAMVTLRHQVDVPKNAQESQAPGDDQGQTFWELAWAIFADPASNAFTSDPSHLVFSSPWPCRL